MPRFPKGALNYWKAQFLTDLSDDAIRTLIAGFEACPSPMSHIIIEHFHGAASRVPVAATACTMRVTGFNVVIISQWMDPGETERGIAWARETYASLTPYLAPTRYVNYLEDDAIERRGGRLRTEPPAAEGDQDEVRPGEFLQAQRQHSAMRRDRMAAAAGLSLDDVLFRCGDPGRATSARRGRRERPRSTG